MTLTLNLPPEAARADAGYQAKLRRAPNAKPLSIEETGREALYGDDMR